MPFHFYHLPLFPSSISKLDYIHYHLIPSLGLRNDEISNLLRFTEEGAVASIQLQHIPRDTAISNHSVLSNEGNRVVLLRLDIRAPTVEDGIRPGGRSRWRAKSFLGLRLESSDGEVGSHGGDVIVEDILGVLNSELAGFGLRLLVDGMVWGWGWGFAHVLEDPGVVHLAGEVALQAVALTSHECAHEDQSDDAALLAGGGPLGFALALGGGGSGTSAIGMEKHHDVLAIVEQRLENIVLDEGSISGDRLLLRRRRADGW